MQKKKNNKNGVNLFLASLRVGINRPKADYSVLFY